MYATYLGGELGTYSDESVTDIDVGADGSAYITARLNPWIFLSLVPIQSCVGFVDSGVHS